ncbi:hypothetical protein ACS0TY_015465 [Phlomoides rotata]
MRSSHFWCTTIQITTKENVSRLGPIKVNGFKLEQCSSPSITNREENGSPWDQNGNRWFVVSY